MSEFATRERAIERANKIIDTYNNDDNDRQCNLIDALVDLMHWASQPAIELSFDAALKQAKKHFASEK